MQRARFALGAVCGMLVLGLLAGCPSTVETDDNDIQEISFDDFVDRIEHPEKDEHVDLVPMVVVDVRVAGRYDRMHIPGSINLPLASVRAGDPHLAQAKSIVVYANSWQDQLAPAAWKRMHYLGYNNVFVYRGGLDLWIKRGRAVEGDEAMEAASGN